MIPWLKEVDPFPDVPDALDETTGFPGLLAAGADLSPERLVKAYRPGYIPLVFRGPADFMVEYRSQNGLAD